MIKGFLKPGIFQIEYKHFDFSERTFMKSIEKKYLCMLYMGVKTFGEIVNNHNLTNLEYIVIIWENFVSIVQRPFAKKLHTLKRIME